MRTSTAILVLIASLSTTGARGDVLHVPGEYPTIQQGIDAASPGDIVLVATGEYFEEITLRAGVIVQGAGEGLSIINGGGDSGDVVRAIGNDITADTKLQGFTVTGAISGGSMPGGGGVFCNSGAAPEIRNNRIEGNDTGIATWNNSSASIYNNVVVYNTYKGVSLSSPSAVINNTIAHNSIGIYDSGGYRPTIMNNIVTSNASHGIGCVNASVPTNISYNDVWNNGNDYYNCYPGVGDISEDPLFEDEPGGDYHLRAGSPCIDAGNPLAQYNDPDGSRNDMGAYGGPGAAADTPDVSMVSPAQNEIDVSRDANVSAVFTVEMDPSTLNWQTVILQGHLTGIRPASLTYDAQAKMVTADPDADFLCGERVTAILTEEIESQGGQPFGGFLWQFTCRVAGGSGTYASPVGYASGTYPEGIVTADFDTDGSLDLALANSGSGDVTVLLGYGDGSFAAATPVAAGGDPADLAAADLDGDGALDLAVANAGAGDVAVLLGNGDGSFGSAAHFAAGTSPEAVGIQDMNDDGIPDLAVANSGSDDVSILLGQGDGSFLPAVHYPAGASPRAVGLADLDGDGILDLAVANQTGGTVSIRLGRGDGTFDSEATYPAGIGPCSIDLGDFDHDGVPDLAVANRDPGTVSILRGSGSGGFGSPVPYAVGPSPLGVFCFDGDGDGDLDLAVANSGSSTISILLGSGSGTFGPATEFVCDEAPFALTGGDFDGDGDVDLSAACRASSLAAVLLNRNAPQVSALSPGQYALDTPAATDVAATFNMDMDPATLTGATFRLHGRQSGPHAGTVAYNAGAYTVTLDPAADLARGEMVTATLTRDIQAGNGVDFGGFSWNFTAAVSHATNGSFSDLTSYPAAAEPRGIYAADYDADGNIDIAVTSSNYPNPGRIVILLGHGDGTFAGPAFYQLGAADPIAVYAADLDGDGDIDIATAHNEPGLSHLVILKNNGDATFFLAGTYAPAILGQDVWGGDLDADGDVDLIMTDGWGSANNVHVLLNNGSGSFGLTRTYTAGTWAREVVVEDVDRDGDLDLAVASSGDGNLSILLNDSHGDFSVLANYAIGSSPGAIFGNDLNGDGWVDFAGGGSGHVSVILNNGDGTFGSPAAHSVSGTAKSLVAVDLDGDGDQDLTASLGSTQVVWVALNNGDGTYANISQYGVGDYPWGIHAADFDLDGDLDLCSAIFHESAVQLLFNTGMSRIGEEGGPLVGLTRPTLEIYPNPFAASTTITWGGMTAAGAGERPMAIYDVAGRLVRSLPLAGGEAGAGRVTWDGTDDWGQPVHGGTYFCRMNTGGQNLTRRVLHIR